MKALPGRVIGSLLAIFAWACSSGSSGGSGTPPKDAGPDVINDPMNCVPPGTPGNSLGIGGYCSPLGGQCDMAGPGGAARICTADITSTPAHAWFCTYPCNSTADCGTGNTCVMTSMGSGCVPLACAYLDDGGLIDAGGNDASDSGASDAPRD